MKSGFGFAQLATKNRKTIDKIESDFSHMCEQIMPTHSTDGITITTAAADVDDAVGNVAIVVAIYCVAQTALARSFSHSIHTHTFRFLAFGYVRQMWPFILIQNIKGSGFIRCGAWVFEITHTCKHSFAGPKNDWHYSLVAHFRFPFKIGIQYVYFVLVYLLLCLTHTNNANSSPLYTVHTMSTSMESKWCAFKQFSNILAFSCLARGRERESERDIK